MRGNSCAKGFIGKRDVDHEHTTPRITQPGIRAVCQSARPVQRLHIWFQVGQTGGMADPVWVTCLWGREAEHDNVSRRAMVAKHEAEFEAWPDWKTAIVCGDEMQFACSTT